MKHVVFIIPTLTGGGAERVILTLAKFLDRARFRVTLAVVDMRNAALRADIPPDVEFIGTLGMVERVLVFGSMVLFLPLPQPFPCRKLGRVPPAAERLDERHC